MAIAFDIHLFISTFLLIFIAELPDKTAFATLLMASKGHPIAIFIGVAAAFLVQTLVAICFGKVFSFLPPHWVHIGSGILFLAFAVVAWLKREEQSEEASHQNNESAVPRSGSLMKEAAGAFIVIFIAEWGDLTQIATAALVAKYKSPWTIFSGAVLGLWSATALAIFVGNRAQKIVNPVLLQKIAAFAFAGVGIAILVT